MKKFQTLFVAAFLASVGLAACDRNEAPDAGLVSGESGAAQTVMQPDNMPAPATEVPADLGGPTSRVSALKNSTSRQRAPEVKVLWI